MPDQPYKFAAVVNSHSSYHDVLKIFLQTFRKYCPSLKLYIFTDRNEPDTFLSEETVIIYQGDTFRDQYLFGLKHVSEDIILTLNDDYFITGIPDWNTLSSCVEILQSSEYSQIRLHRGLNFSETKISDNLYQLDPNAEFFFSQTATLWKKDSLKNIFENTAPSGIARQRKVVDFESFANNTTSALGLSGLVYFNNEEKRGMYHYDCSILPHVVSAIVDGRWNFLEYKNELEDLSLEFDIEVSVRGKNSSFFYRFLEPANAYIKRLIMRN